jgi:hypothetical protein
MDCALCHLAQADDGARRAALAAGAFELANTATLSQTGLVTISPSESGPVTWHPEAFAAGLFPADSLRLASPDSPRCGSCHGTVHLGSEPLRTPDGRRSLSTGVVYSGQRVDQSALNLVGKDALGRSWDVHAERLVECSDCHYSPNHPAYREEGDTRPDHLRFDPRKTALGAYLERPSHDFAKGASAGGAVTDANRMRRCEGCHDPQAGHAFLPEGNRHFDALTCESCHVPEVPWTARQQLDWTALDADGAPLEDWRGTEGGPEDPAALHAGYRPILLPRAELDGRSRLAPYHLSTTFVWVSGGAPVPREALAAAWADVPALLPTFDADGDGALSDLERRLDRPEKVGAIAARLREAGVGGPEILGFVDAWPVHHGIVGGDHAVRECTDCHGEGSMLDRGLELAAWVPGEVRPTLRGAAARVLDPDGIVRDGEALVARAPARQGRYVFGADRIPWVDWAGLFAIVGAVGFVTVHGGLRALTRNRRGGHP